MEHGDERIGCRKGCLEDDAGQRIGRKGWKKNQSGVATDGSIRKAPRTLMAPYSRSCPANGQRVTERLQPDCNRFILKNIPERQWKGRHSEQISIYDSEQETNTPIPFVRDGVFSYCGLAHGKTNGRWSDDCEHLLSATQHPQQYARAVFSPERLLVLCPCNLPNTVVL